MQCSKFDYGSFLFVVFMYAFLRGDNKYLMHSVCWEVKWEEDNFGLYWTVCECVYVCVFLFKYEVTLGW